MRKSTKIWLIVASSLTLFGALVFTFAMMTENWDFTKLSIVRYETNSYIITEPIEHVQINADTANIKILPAEDDVCRVECYEQSGAKHTVEMEGERLIITSTDSRQWYEYISVGVQTATITVYLPEDVYGHISVLATTGDFSIENLNLNVLSCTLTAGKIIAQNLDCIMDVRLTVSTGNTIVKNVVCDGFISKGNTGDTMLENLISTGTFEVYRTTGNVNFFLCDAPEICIETDTGNVTGSWLTPKIILTETDTGKVNVPASTTGGKCSVKTTTGDVNISIK